MVVTLVRLHLALRRRAAGSSGSAQRGWFLLRWLVAIIAGLAGAATVAGAHWLRPSAGSFALVGVFSLIGLAWIALPLAFPGVAGTGADPRLLLDSPATPAHQVLARLIASLLGPAGVATLIASAGVTLLSTERWQQRILPAVIALVFTVVCLAASAAVRGVVAVTGSARIVRPVALLVVIATPILLSMGFDSAGGPAALAARLQDGPVQGLLGVLPSGASIGVLDAIVERRWLTVAIAGAELVAVGVIAVWAMSWTVARWVDLPPRPAPSSAGRSLTLLPYPLDRLPATPWVGAAAQQLRYAFLRSGLGARAIVLVPLLGLVPATALSHSFGVLAAAAGFAVIAATTLVNVLGVDGPGVRSLADAGTLGRPVLIGKVLAGLGWLATLLAVFLVILAALERDWNGVFPAWLAGTAILSFAAALGSFTSVLAPYDLRRFDRPAFLRTTAFHLAAMAILVGVVGVGLIGWVRLADQFGATLLATGLLGLAAAALSGALWFAGRLAARRSAAIAAAFSA